MRRIAALILTATIALTAPVHAQDKAETLADIRQELTVLYVEVQKLKRELSTTGAAGGLNTSGSVIDRVGAIEGELQRLTARSEDMQLRIEKVVADGTNRIGDLEFRLVELEGGDTSKLGDTTTLGGGAKPQSGGNAIQPAETSIQPGEPLALGEKADFDAAEAAVAAGDNAGAARLYSGFLDTYPGSPLAPRAYLARGEALEASGDMKQAAKSYLDGFSADKNGPEAPKALFRLGRALGQIGQRDAACQTLGEVETRFPGSDPASKARGEMQTLGCQ